MQSNGCLIKNHTPQHDSIRHLQDLSGRVRVVRNISQFFHGWRMNFFVLRRDQKTCAPQELKATLFYHHERNRSVNHINLQDESKRRGFNSFLIQNDKSKDYFF